MDRYDMAVRLLEWAGDHPREWNIVCGFERGSLEQALDIAETLRGEGFHELCLMMTVRAAGICLERERKEEG